jgi:riboflavin biosynthesis pyrimidine reductase
LQLRDGRLNPTDIASALRAEGLHSLLVEGGSITIGRFLEAGLLTRLQIAIAPLLIGGGPQGLTLAAPSPRLADAIRPETRVFSLGSDVVFDCALTAEAAVAAEPLHLPQAGMSRA